MTVGRQAIMDILTKNPGHLSAEDIYLKVHEVYPSIGLTSVYRTLEIMTKLGMVSRFNFGEGKARYELSESEKGGVHHHHLICTQCNKVIDYSDFVDQEVKLLGDIEKALSAKHHFDINGHMMQFYGLCEQCRVKKES